MYTTISRVKRLIASVLLTLVICFTLSSCGGVKKELTLVSESLLSPYAAEMNYRITDDKTDISGRLTVSRADDGIVLTVLEPEELSGLCARYSTAETPDTVEISYEGITTEMPAEALSRLNIAISLLTDDFAMTVLRLPPESVKPGSSDGDPKRIEFNYCGTDVSFAYDPDTGSMTGFSALRDGVRVSGEVTKSSR